MKELRWEREVLEQRFSKLEAEKDKLHKNFVSAIQEVVQKSNFKKLFLERKGKIFNDFHELLLLYTVFRFYISMKLYLMISCGSRRFIGKERCSAQRNLGCVQSWPRCPLRTVFKISIIEIKWKKSYFFACRFWIYVLNLLQSLRVNSKTFSTRRMARSKISSTSWLEFARYKFF